MIVEIIWILAIVGGLTWAMESLQPDTKVMVGATILLLLWPFVLAYVDGVPVGYSLDCNAVGDPCRESTAWSGLAIGVLLVYWMTICGVAYLGLQKLYPSRMSFGRGIWVEYPSNHSLWWVAGAVLYMVYIYGGLQLLSIYARPSTLNEKRVSVSWVYDNASILMLLGGYIIASLWIMRVMSRHS